MAINFTTDTDLTGRVDGASSEYPLGTFKDKSSASSNDGTPIGLAKIWKDVHGFMQAILKRGNIDAADVSGNPDNALNSNFADALFSQYTSNGFQAKHPSSTPTVPGDYGYSTLQYHSVNNYKTEGTSYALRSGLINGGVFFSGSPNVGDASSVTFKRVTFNVTPSLFTLDTIVGSGGFNYKVIRVATPTSKELVGIPKTAKIFNVELETREAGVGVVGARLNYTIDYTGTWPLLIGGTSMISSTTLYTESMLLHVDFDPSSVD